MFYGLENTQKGISDLLRKLVDDNALPASLLFSGPEFSSRMYASLCLAKHYGADIDSTVIFSDRNQTCRILTALNLYRKSRNKASKEFLKDTIGCFLKQFHGALIDYQSSSVRKKFSDANETMELLNSIDSVKDDNALSFADKLEKSVSSLVDLHKYSSNASSVTVDQIRGIKQWCSISSLEGKQKFVIIEGLENSTVSASNALLKLLEEPPVDTHFILISSNTGLIPQTILSRVRKFIFKPFSDSEKKYVLNNLFINPIEYDSLESFFINFSGMEDSLLASCAENIVNNKKCNIPDLISSLSAHQTWDRFFSLIVLNLRNSINSGLIDEKKGEFLVEEIEKNVSKGGLYNTNKQMTFDFIVNRIGEVLS